MDIFLFFASILERALYFLSLIKISPLVGTIIPAIIPINVDFPAPFLPIIPWTFPFSISIFIFFNAIVPGYIFEIFFNRKALLSSLFDFLFKFFSVIIHESPSFNSQTLYGFLNKISFTCLILFQ